MPWELTGNAGTNPATNFLGTQDNQPLLIKTNDIEAIHINPGELGPQTDGRARIGGNVGVGTPSPASKLHVVGPGGGAVVATIEQPAGGGMNFVDLRSSQGGGNYGSDIRFVDSGVVNAEVKSTANSQLRFATSSVDHVTIDSSGNVGIGTTSPEATLHVSGVASQVRIDDMRGDNDNGHPILRFHGQSASVFGSPPVPFDWDIATTPDAVQFARNGDIQMVIEGSGNVGIGTGTSTPSARLHVVGNVLVQGNLSSTGAKPFVQTHPTDPSKEIVYVALEGGEAGTYVRGTANLRSGKAVIELPEHFSLVTNEDGLTVQLTPRGKWLQLYVVELDTKQIVVQEAQGQSGQFHYLIQGVRKGYESHEVIREKVGARA